jgi:hypothetical protein
MILPQSGLKKNGNRQISTRGARACAARDQKTNVSVHVVIELVEIPNNKSQKTNKFQHASHAQRRRLRRVSACAARDQNSKSHTL